MSDPACKVIEPRRRGIIQLLKPIVAGVAAPLHIGVLAAGKRRPAAVLCYHSVAVPARPGRVTPGQFRDQIAWLSQHYSVVSLTEVLRGEPGIALTFDDAYTTVAENAAPLLAAAGLPYTVAVPTGRLGSALEPLDPQCLPERVMSWEELGALPGQVTFASHMVTHRPVSELTDLELVQELERSRTSLFDRLGDQVVDVVIWPYGASDQRAREAARSVGYTHALAGGWGTDPRPDSFEHRRIGVDELDTPTRLWMKVSGGWNWISHARSAAAFVRHRQRV